MDSIKVSMRHLIIMSSLRATDRRALKSVKVNLKRDPLKDYMITDYIKATEEKQIILKEKSIFSDTEGLWATLPLEILMNIMTRHSRNNNQYWGSISFTLTPHRYFENPHHNPYKNVVIYQHAPKWRLDYLSSYQRAELKDEEKDDIKSQKIKYGKRYVATQTKYGKQRDLKICVNRAIKDSLMGFQSKMGWAECLEDFNMIPSKMKCKYITEDVNNGKQYYHWKYIARDGITDAEHKKQIRIQYISVDKGYFHPKVGFIKENNTVLKIKSRVTKKYCKVEMTAGTQSSIELINDVRNKHLITTY